MPDVSVPAFRPFKPATGGDFFDRAGAYDLAQRIREAWLRAGWTVRVWVEPMDKSDSGRQQHAVRSDLVNGLPRASSMALELAALKQQLKAMEG